MLPGAAYGRTMRLIGLMPVRNESWCLGLSLRAALMWCDEVILLLHACTDASEDICSAVAKDFPHQVRRMLGHTALEWNEMQHRQWMLDNARAASATHVAIIDADEVLSGNLLPSIRNQIAQLQGGRILQIPMRNMYGARDLYSEEQSIWARALTSIAFADSPELSWNPGPDGYQHHHREPQRAIVGLRIYPQQMDGGVMHLQFANRRRLLAKHALYKMQEVIRWPGRRPLREIDRDYNQAPKWRPVELKQAPESWWAPYTDLLQYLHLDAEPWQERECQRLMDEHGPEKFAGLDLFGVVENVPCPSST